MLIYHDHYFKNRNQNNDDSAFDLFAIDIISDLEVDTHFEKIRGFLKPELNRLLSLVRFDTLNSSVFVYHKSAENL